jgi:hypothetical protein
MTTEIIMKFLSVQSVKITETEILFSMLAALLLIICHDLNAMLI